MLVGGGKKKWGKTQFYPIFICQKLNKRRKQKTMARLNSKKKILIASLLVGVLLIGAIVSIVVVLAAQTQNIQTNISINYIVDGVAVVDKEACKACGKCVAACPKKLIELVPYDQKHLVQCSSQDKGKDVMKACSVGCIGCGICSKNCPSEAVVVENNIAHIDQDKCTGCGICAEKCPKKIIL